MAKRSKSSGRWLREHFDDEFVQRAQKEGWRSRAVFKLQEIDRSERLLRPGMTVVDLGAAPGGWSQYAGRILGERGRVIAMDVLPMDPLPGVEFLQGDFREQDVLDRLEQILAGARVDLVLSDMAPNLSGVDVVDQPRAMYLAELALDFAATHLKPGGTLLTKVFQGAGFDALLKDARARFAEVRLKKPKASRLRSPEVYLLARGPVV
ncbi:MAG: 23S rRNA (uridine(2552)-2'-O)-methyltransferase RlmE [Steroidobacteraceae bacterium]